MKNTFLKHASMFAAIMLVVLSSCKDDDDKKSAPLVKIDDPNAVAASIKVANGTFKSGNPPAPSTDPAAPKIDASINNKEIISLQSSKVVVEAPITNGDAAGFYVQVSGSNGYYEVASTVPTGRKSSTGRSTGRLKSLFSLGKKTEDDNAAFTIELPPNIQPGQFCISYCVYDAQNRVSNIITRCVVVSALGGANSSFLTAHPWKAYKETWTYNDQTDEYFFGTKETYTYDEEIPCDNDYKNVQITLEYQTDADITFATNGAFTINISDYEKYLDWEGSNCTPKYKTETYNDSWNGGWSYDSSTKKLIIIYNEVYDGITATETEIYTAEVVNGDLILKYDEPFLSESFTLVLKKK